MSEVSYTWDTLPPITPEGEARLKALAEMPDSEIDYSDIPPLDPELWKNSIPNPFCRTAKSSVVASSSK